MRVPWSIPYGNPAPNPYWGAQTSAVNFCEEDYIITRYVAEFCNALTSLIYIGYGYYAIRRYKRHDTSLLAGVNLPYWGLIAVGIFSGLYHATMKYHTQMADEMSMHLAMGFTLIRLYTFERPPAIQKRNFAIIAGGLTLFIIYHCITDEFTLHVLLFLAECCTVTFTTRYIVHHRFTDKSQRAKINTIQTFGCVLGLSSYALWNIDVHLCPTLTNWKRELGMPWSFVLELHSWWHIGTAATAYNFIAAIEFLTSSEDDESHGQAYLWPVNAILNNFASEQRSGKEANGKIHANGHMNGHMNGDAKKKL